MKLNVSIVLYHTPIGELTFVLQTLLECKSVNHIYVHDNSERPLRNLPVEADCITYEWMKDNIGFGAAHNIAIRHTLDNNVPYHLVMNSDVSFHHEDVEHLLRYMEEHEDVGMIQPKVLYPTGMLQPLSKLLPTPMDWFGRRFLPAAWIQQRNNHFELRATGHTRIMNVPYLSGCFMLCRTSVLREVGLFDERYFMYSEDCDLTRRMHRVSKTLFYPEVTIYHDFRRTSYHSLRILLIHIYTTCQYFNKWGWWHDAERDQINKQVLDELGLL